MKNIAILGSTGSIGVNTLDVVAGYPRRYRVVALAGGRNVKVLKEQTEKFHPEVVSISTRELAEDLKEMLGRTEVEIVPGPDGLLEVATYEGADLIVSATSGISGLRPTLSAVQKGKDIALANKETIVVGGELIMSEVARMGVNLIPVDSEHSAIFQCINKNVKGNLTKVTLTASGGPFLDTPLDKFHEITPEKALKHPRWKMGPKVTIDSATMANKGLEVIEACFLFDISPDQVKVLIHPQSIIHSMVEFCDGSTLAQLATPDMRIPISYALAYPDRLELNLPKLDMTSTGPLSFMEVDNKRFPILNLAYEALRAEQGYSTVFNAANEVAVEAFLERKIPFTAIYPLVSKTLEDFGGGVVNGLDEILSLDKWARDWAGEELSTSRNWNNGILE